MTVSALLPHCSGGVNKLIHVPADLNLKKNTVQTAWIIIYKIKKKECFAPWTTRCVFMPMFDRRPDDAEQFVSKVIYTNSTKKNVKNERVKMRITAHGIQWKSPAFFLNDPLCCSNKLPGTKIQPKVRNHRECLQTWINLYGNRWAFVELIKICKLLLSSSL